MRRLEEALAAEDAKVTEVLNASGSEREKLLGEQEEGGPEHIQTITWDGIHSHSKEIV